MVLNQLLQYDDIVIQIHDNPDADAVGSGYAIYQFLKEHGKQVRLVYGGRYPISKNNMVMFIRELEIPVEYVTELAKPQLLVTVDCQYGEGNVQTFEAEHIAMIDHHNTGKMSDDMSEIRSHLVSCATICYAMLRDEGYDINANNKVATALYYGLFMDSNQLSEISHPYDKDMIELLQFDRDLINRLKYANLSIVDFETAGFAILSKKYNEQYRYALIKVKECDPNLLGVIGDFALQVDCIDVGVSYCEYPGGYKISVRSCLMEVAANELSSFLTEGIGDGGGHLDKAGGFISQYKFLEKYENMDIEEYFRKRMTEYYEEYEVVRFGEGMKDREAFKKYRKRANMFGFVKTTDLFEEGVECKVRTLEGDVFVTCAEDTYIMIGLEGEVYPIKKDTFEQRYSVSEVAYDKVFDYSPSVIKQGTNTLVKILPIAKACMSKPGAMIWAKPVDIHTKVFTRWNYETYMNARPGDMICYSMQDENDVYVVQRSNFAMIYEEVL